MLKTTYLIWARNRLISVIPLKMFFTYTVVRYYLHCGISPKEINYLVNIGLDAQAPLGDSVAQNLQHTN